MILSAALVAMLAAYLAAFFAISVTRIPYPYQLDDLEDAALAEIQRVVQGQPIYVAPTLEYVPLVYGPVYFYASAAVATITGASFLPLRLVATLASAGTISLAGLLVRRETASTLCGLVAAGLLAATYPLMNGALNVARTDSTCVFLLVAVLYVVRGAALARRAHWWPLAGAGCLTGLAVLTKQTSAIVALAIVVYLAWTARGQLIAYLGGLALTVGLLLLLLSAQSAGWVFFYLWDLPRRHDLRADQFSGFWRDDMLPRATVPLLLGPIFLIARAQARDWISVRFFGLLGASLLAMACLSRSTFGGASNVLLPAHAVLAIVAALGLREALVQLAARPAFQAYALCIAVFQCVVLFYSPRPLAPYRSDSWADERMVHTLADLHGSVFAPSYGGYMGHAQASIGALAELTGGYGGGMTPQGAQWLADLSAALNARHYDYVLLGPESTDFFVRGVVERTGYVRVGPLFAPNDPFWAWRRSAADAPPGMFLTPKADVYVPVERTNSTGEETGRTPGEAQ